MIIPWLYAVLTGIFTTIEVSINAKLGKIVTPNIATLHSLITGMFFILFINIILGTVNQYVRIIHVSPQWLVGGIFGALIIYFATKSIIFLGVSNALTVIIASQLISGLIIDVMVLQNQAFHFIKILGVFLLLIGVYFIIK